MTISSVFRAVARELTDRPDLDSSPEFILLPDTKTGHEGTVNFYCHLPTNLTVALKTFHDPYFPDALYRHARASTMYRRLLPDTPRFRVISPNILVSEYVQAPTIPLSHLVELPSDITAAQAILTHMLADLALGKGDGADNTLTWSDDTHPLHLAPIDNSFTFCSLPTASPDLVIDPLEFVEDTAHLIRQAVDILSPSIARRHIMNTVRRIIRFNDQSNKEYPYYKRVVEDNIFVILDPENMSRLENGDVAGTNQPSPLPPAVRHT